MNIILIDPGHGGRDPGATSECDSIRESDLNLRVSLALAQALQDRGFVPILTRYVDTDLGLDGRCLLEHTIKPRAFVSIHQNGHADSQANGFEVWTSPGQTGADSLAEAIHRRLDDRTILAARVDWSDGDRDKEGHLAVLAGTFCPAVLVECGFVTNDRDLAILLDSRTRATIVDSIADGIECWVEGA